MWNKKIIVTDHAIFRFNQRRISYSKPSCTPVNQILHDLKPLNVRKREKIESNKFKVTTNQGKVYILQECNKVCFVVTVYKTNIQWEIFNDRR